MASFIKIYLSFYRTPIIQNTEFYSSVFFLSLFFNYSARLEKLSLARDHTFAGNLYSMQTTNIQQDYHERINKVLLFIDDHLGEKLDLATLASISCFSPYHFHRIMRAHLNESLGSYIIRQRLQAAALMLEFSPKSITEIAYTIGYDTPSSLTKAFKSRFGVSPSGFRESKCKLQRFDRNLLFNLKETDMELKPEIRQINTIKVLYIQAIGDYNNVGPAWERLCSFAGRNNLFGKNTKMIGLSHDDPDITETSKLRYDACLSLDKDVRPEGEIGVKEIAGGKYAVFIHKGPYADLHKSYNDIFRNWFPESEFELGDSEPLEIYLNDPDSVKPEELLTEICIPLK
jgi:AraC family transcriptional regulator